ncbi:MAG: proton-conducting transporter membrane subunit, partial [Bacteroidota bacterium]
ILYGTVDSFFIHQWQASSFDELHPVVGLGLMLFGLFFKASVFPFHIWVPATYQSAPNDVVAFISIVPKLASLLLLKRILAIFPATHFITELCLGFGLLTMAVGTFAALRQSNARRMISLGAIAHSGFLLPLAIIPTTSSEASLFWYTTVYMFMNFGIFYLIDFFESNEVYLLGGYASLGKKFPVIGVSLTILCISLVGLPPVAGFTAKFLFFTTLWEQYVTVHSPILMLYLVVSVLLTVVSLFFYLKIPYQLFLVKEQTSQSINPTISTKIIATLFSIVMLLLFFVPHLVMNLQRLINYTFL